MSCKDLLPSLLGPVSLVWCLSLNYTRGLNAAQEPPVQAAHAYGNVRQHWLRSSLALSYTQDHLRGWGYHHLPVYCVISTSIPRVLRYPSIHDSFPILIHFRDWENTRPFSPFIVPPICCHYFCSVWLQVSFLLLFISKLIPKSSLPGASLQMICCLPSLSKPDTFWHAFDDFPCCSITLFASPNAI